MNKQVLSMLLLICAVSFVNASEQLDNVASTAVTVAESVVSSVESVVAKVAPKVEEVVVNESSAAGQFLAQWLNKDTFTNGYNYVTVKHRNESLVVAAVAVTLVAMYKYCPPFRKNVQNKSASLKRSCKKD